MKPVRFSVVSLGGPNSDLRSRENPVAGQQVMGYDTPQTSAVLCQRGYIADFSNVLCWQSNVQGGPKREPLC